MSWSWLPEEDSSKDIGRWNEAPPDTSSYGEVDRQDNVAPPEYVSMSAEGMSTSDKNDARDDYRARNAIVTYTAWNGDSYTGQIVGFKASGIRFTDRWNVSIRMEITA